MGQQGNPLPRQEHFLGITLGLLGKPEFIIAFDHWFNPTGSFCHPVFSSFQNRGGIVLSLPSE